LDRSPVRAALRCIFRCGCAVLLAILGVGCSDEPTRPGPAGTGSWRGIGLFASFVEVDALTTWDGLLVAAGIFDRLQGVDTNLLTWDGANWNPLEPFVLGVNALSVYNGDLIAGGGFHQVNVDTLSSIAAWDGTKWTPLGSELNKGSVTAMTIYEGDLVAAVHVYGVGDSSFVATWDGNSWRSMGALNGYVNAMTEFQGLLYVGGSFNTAGGVPAKGMAAWNGTVWTSVGGGIGGGMNSTGHVLALAVDGATLVAGGDFLTAGGVPVVNVARWNGTVWESLGAGLGHPSISVYVRALAIFEDALVAGGVLAPDAVRRWNRNDWKPMSSLYGVVMALTIHNGSLIAGGYFPTSHSQSSDGIVRWVP
jgi:hypothetical protein